VRAELQSKAKLTPEQVDTGGFKIITTINPKDQEAAVNAVNSLPPGASPNPHFNETFLKFWNSCPSMVIGEVAG